jgi:two-component system, cell cycle sensor histidine kinase and response regulator CckA
MHRILLVEDEAPIREMLTRLLNGKGYELLVAANGREAVDLVEQEGGVDLLISDLIMPGPNGAEVASELRARVPNLGVLFISGWADHPALQRVLDAGDRFIPKPFSLSEFSSVVREVLAQSGAPHPSIH